MKHGRMENLLDILPILSRHSGMKDVKKYLEHRARKSIKPREGGEYSGYSAYPGHTSPS